MKDISFLDLSTTNAVIKDEFMTKLSKLYDSGHYIKGTYCAEFEEKFASMHNATYCIGVNNGTSALHAAIEAIKDDSKNIERVLLADNTFLAQLEAVNLANIKYAQLVPATPNYLMDVDDFKNMDLSKCIIIFTSLYGNYEGLSEIIDLCKEHGTPIIIDNAQGMVNDYLRDCIAKYDKLIVTYSHYAGKNIGSIGEAGSIVTNNIDYSEFIKRYISHGSVHKYVHDMLGHNYRMDEVTGLFMSIKLGLHDEILRKRKYNFLYFNASITNKLIKKPAFNSTHTIHQYVVEVENRSVFATYMSTNGIPVMVHYPHSLTDITKHLTITSNINCTIIDNNCETVNHNAIVSLPIHENLSDDDLDHIIKVINNWDGDN